MHDCVGIQGTVSNGDSPSLRIIDEEEWVLDSINRLWEPTLPSLLFWIKHWKVDSRFSERAYRHQDTSAPNLSSRDAKKKSMTSLDVMNVGLDEL